MQRKVFILIVLCAFATAAVIVVLSYFQLPTSRNSLGVLWAFEEPNSTLKIFEPNVFGANFVVSEQSQNSSFLLGHHASQFLTTVAPRVVHPAPTRKSQELNATHYLQVLADSCCFHGNESCCGIISCWSSNLWAINPACSRLFVNVSVRAGVGFRSSSIAKSSAFTAVLDFFCDHTYTEGIFHALMDCFIPSLPLVIPALQHKFASIAVVYPGNMANYMNSLCRFMVGEGVKVTFFRVIAGRAFDRKEALCLAEHSSLAQISIDTGYDTWRRYNRSIDQSSSPLSVFKKKLFAAMIREAYNLTCVTPCDKIVVILRNGHLHMRGFIDEVDLLAALSDHFGKQHIVPFHGSENFSATVHLFSSACAVVGYHGAGMINMLYTCPGALQLEVTTFNGTMDGMRMISKGWDAWRSNHIVSFGMDTFWEPKLVEHHHLWPRRVHSNYAERTLKEANILLTREHIDDIIRRLEHFLVTRSHAILVVGRNPSNPRRPVSKSFSMPTFILDGSAQLKSTSNPKDSFKSLNSSANQGLGKPILMPNSNATAVFARSLTPQQMKEFLREKIITHLNKIKGLSL